MCMRHGRALLLPLLLPRFDNSTSSDSKTGFCGDCGGLTTIYATIWSLFGLLRVEKLAVSNREFMRVVSVFLFHVLSFFSHAVFFIFFCVSSFFIVFSTTKLWMYQWPDLCYSRTHRGVLAEWRQTLGHRGRFA